MTAFTLAALTTELQTDPKGLGYAPLIVGTQDDALAALINSTYVGVGVVWRQDLSQADILKSIVYSEAVAKTVNQLTLLHILCEPKSVDASEQRVRDIFVGIFPTGTTLANLTAVAKVAAPTRGEELWGSGVRVTSIQIANALGRG